MRRLFRIIDGGKPGKRLRGLEEFETPEFVGRMDRVADAKSGPRWAFWALFVLALGIGGMIGWWMSR